MYPAVACKGFITQNTEFGTFEISYTSAGFPYYYNRGCNIPGLELAFPEAVYAARGKITEVYGSRAGPPYLLSLHHKLPEQTKIVIRMLPSVIRKPCCEKCAVKPVNPRYMDCPAIQISAASFHCSKTLIPYRVIHNTNNHLPRCLKPYRDCKAGE